MQGLSLTGSNEAAVNYDRAISHLVRFQIEVIEAQVSARAADPGCAMAGVFGAYLSLMSTEATGVAGAREVLGGIEGDPDVFTPWSGPIWWPRSSGRPVTCWVQVQPWRRSRCSGLAIFSL